MANLRFGSSADSPLRVVIRRPEFPGTQYRIGRRGFAAPPLRYDTACDIRARIWYDAPMRKSIFHRIFKLGPLQLHVYVPPRSRRPGRGIEDGMIPAVPDRPKNLSGGAAAALEFDD